jgi:tubulin polyglutamylase TTLL1
MKASLMNDIINIVLPPSGFPDVRWNKTPSKESLGKFDLLYDEELAMAEAREREVKSRAGHRGGAGGRKPDPVAKKPVSWK